MKEIVRPLTLFTAWLALLAHVRLPNGRLRWLFAVPKRLAGPFTPFLALAGAAGALFGWRRDRLTAAAGVAGALLAHTYIRKVSAPHGEFAFAFGADWEQRIPHHLRWRLRPKRYTTRPLTATPVPVAWHQRIGSDQETGEPLLAHIWQPPDNTAHSGMGVIYLYGGRWPGGRRPLFQYLANQGHVVVGAPYTPTPKTGLISIVAHVKRVIVWLKTNAADLGLNPERIVLMGDAAGAHLALLAAYTPGRPLLGRPLLGPEDTGGGDTAVRGVISCYGVSDVISAAEYVARLPIEPELYTLASPILHVGHHCPATLLINGTHDVCLDNSQHRQLQAVLYRYQIPCVHVELDGADHDFYRIVPRWSPSAQAALYDIERFLALLV